MKSVLLLLAVFIIHQAFAQKNMVIADANSKAPIADVQVFNSHGSFIGISNQDGKFKTSESQFPLRMKHYAYNTKLDVNYADTIFLEPSFQEISEVFVKPVNKLDRYNEIIEHSSELARTPPQESENALFRNIGGVYYKSVLLVNLDNFDSVRIDATCDLRLNVGMKRNPDYTFICSNGKKHYNESKNYSGSMDTSIVAKCLGFVPKFDKNLKYDLTDTKAYKLKFDEEDIHLGRQGDYQMLQFIEEKKRSDQYNVLFKELQLKLWEYKTYSNKEYEGGAIFVDFDFIKSNIVFTDSEDLYFFNELQNKTQIELVAGGERYLIMAVQGFIETEIDSEEQIESKPEDYLEAIDYSQSEGQLYNFENFDERNAD